MSNKRQNKSIIQGIAFYGLACLVMRILIKTISPLIIVAFLTLPLLYVSIVMLKKERKGIEKILNILFISLLDISCVILFMNIIVIEAFPEYLEAHKVFFRSSFIVFVCLFALSAIVCVAAKVSEKR